MILYNKSLLLTIESITGKYNLSDQKSLLEASIELSKIRSFQKIKKHQNHKDFDLYQYLKFIIQNKKTYILFVYEIVYILNLRKKFSSENNNRMVSNHFNILFASLEINSSSFTFPQEIMTDREYLTTLALSNLYIISKFGNETKNS